MEVGPAIKRGTPLKFNSEFTPEKWWLEDDPPFLLGFGNFSGAMLNFGRVFCVRRTSNRCLK